MLLCHVFTAFHIFNTVHDAVLHGISHVRTVKNEKMPSWLATEPMGHMLYATVAAEVSEIPCKQDLEEDFSERARIPRKSSLVILHIELDTKNNHIDSQAAGRSGDPVVWRSCRSSRWLPVPRR